MLECKYDRKGNIETKTVYLVEKDLVELKLQYTRFYVFVSFIKKKNPERHGNSGKNALNRVLIIWLKVGSVNDMRPLFSRRSILAVLRFVNNWLDSIEIFPVIPIFSD